jgi:UDP-3-O-[3-hydroxymyristoyl] glucosamine N-acyltransferase
MEARTLGELAKHVGGTVDGDANIIIKSAASLESAGDGDISFLSNLKYSKQVQTTKASAIVVSKKLKSPAALLITDEPYYAFRQIVVLLHGHRKHKQVGVSEKASIAKSARIGKDCHINNFVTIADDAKVGNRCVLYPGVFLGAKSEIGDDCTIYSNAVIYDGCKIGNRVIIQANATIGNDGFGFATHKGEHHKIPHIGGVCIEDDVEIGAGCVIERGSLNDTVIGKGSKVWDMVAIGHGVKIGAYCLLVPQVGVSGSSALGHHCMVGGQVGIAGHIKIGDGVMIGAQSGVANNVEDGKIILGSPAIEAGKAKRAYAIFEHLPDMRKSIRHLEERIAKLEDQERS